MKKTIDPKLFGLPPRTSLEQIEKHMIAIIIDRRSRIIMADGKKIKEKAEKIRKKEPDATIILKTSAPVCSKTEKFLHDEGIQVMHIGK